MLRIVLCIILVPLLILGVTSGASADEITEEYLRGKWVIGSETDCDSPELEHVIFDENSIFQSVRGGKIVAVGFWHFKDDGIVKINIVSSPAYFEYLYPELKDYQGQYRYFNSQIVAFKLSEDRLNAVGILEETIIKAKFSRCSH